MTPHLPLPVLLCVMTALAVAYWLANREPTYVCPGCGAKRAADHHPDCPWKEKL